MRLPDTPLPFLLVPSYAAGQQSLPTSRCSFGAPAPRTTLEHVTVMQDAIEHGRDRRHVTQQFPPVFDGAV
jgi:hypothetical protein